MKYLCDNELEEVREDLDKDGNIYGRKYMPVKTETKTKKDGTKFNPRVGHGFENKKFGEGSILVNIDAEGLKALTENAQIGASILLKYNRVTTQGNKHYFCEILPPMNKQQNTATLGSKNLTGVSDLD